MWMRVCIALPLLLSIAPSLEAHNLRNGNGTDDAELRPAVELEVGSFFGAGNAEPHLVELRPTDVVSIDNFHNGNESHVMEVQEPAPSERLGAWWSVIQQFHRIGGRGGGSFWFSYIGVNEGQSSAVVTKIEAWAGGWQLRGIKFYFSNGAQRMAGKAAGRYQGSITFDWGGGESVTELSIWGNGAGTRCGALRIKTNKGRVYFPRMTSWGLKTEYKMEVGSGIILGAFGGSGSDVDNLGILMLRKIIGTDMDTVQYDMRGANLLPPQKKVALDVTIANPSDTDSDKGFQKIKKEKKTAGHWSVTAGFTFGQTYKVEAGVPKISSASVETRWEVSISGTYGQSWESTSGFETSIPLIAPALEKTRIYVDYYEGQLRKLPFTARMVYFLDNHYKFYNSVSGVYEGVSNTRFVQHSKTVAIWDDHEKKWKPVESMPAALAFNETKTWETSTDVILW